MRITNSEQNRERLAYEVPTEEDGGFRFSLLSSPWIAQKGAAILHDGLVVQHANVSPWGARPALYHLRIIVKGYYGIEIQRKLRTF